MIFLWLAIPALQAQTDRGGYRVDYIGVTEHAFDTRTDQPDYSSAMRRATNEAEFVFAFLYWTYKNFLSSQDIDSCVFYPSCSTYMIESIHKHGALYGFLDGIDRLSRCSPFANGHYPYDAKHRKYADPVQ